MVMVLGAAGARKTLTIRTLRTRITMSGIQLRSERQFMGGRPPGEGLWGGRVAGVAGPSGMRARYQMPLSFSPNSAPRPSVGSRGQGAGPATSHFGAPPAGSHAAPGAPAQPATIRPRSATAPLPPPPGPSPDRYPPQGGPPGSLPCEPRSSSSRAPDEPLLGDVPGMSRPHLNPPDQAAAEPVVEPVHRPLDHLPINRPPLPKANLAHRGSD